MATNFNLATGWIDLSMDDTKLIQSLDKMTAKTKQLTEFIEKGQYQAWQKLGKTAADKLEVVQKKTQFLNRVIKEGKIAAYFGDASDKLGKLNTNMQSFTNKATIAFAIGTAAVTSFVAAASPDAWNTLTGSLKLVTMQLGQGFIPYIKAASRWLQDLWRTLQGLSQEQKENAARWVAMGLAVLGVIAILPRFISLASAIISVVRLIAMNPAWAATAAAIIGLIALTTRWLSVWETVDAKIKKVGESKSINMNLIPQDEKKLLDILPDEDRAKRAFVAQVALKREIDKFMQEQGLIGMAANPGKAVEFANRATFLKEVEASAKKGEPFANKGPGFFGRMAEQGKGQPQNMLLSATLMQPSFTGITEAYKQAQLNVLSKDPIQAAILAEQQKGNQILRDIKDQGGMGGALRKGFIGL